MLENLTKLGFSEKEAMVYMVLLRNGPALASTLAHRTGLKRVSVYSILDALSARGLVSFEFTDLGRRYLPHDPECLLYKLEEEKAQLQVKLDLAKDCIQSLSHTTSIQRLDGRRVVFLKKIEIIKDALADFFDASQKLHGLFSEDLSSDEETLFRELFEKAKLYSKDCLILTPKKLTKWMEKQKNIRWLEHPFPAEKGQILVQGSSVFFVCQREELELMLIRDPSYAKTVLEVLIKPYCEKVGVLAHSSRSSFLKG